MNRLELTTIAHRDHVFCNPLGSAKVDQVLGLLDLPAGSEVLDAGCGKAEMLLRLVERYGVAGVGIDTNPSFLREARAHAAARAPRAALRLEETRADAFPWEPGSFDAALCVGSTHALGGYRATLRCLRRAVRPGGRILVGEGYWKRAPDPEFLAFLGAAPTDYSDHAGNAAAGAEEELILLYTSVSSEDDWDHYEGLYWRGVERHAIAHAGEPGVEEMRAYIRSWRDAYLRWGRSTLGFGLYLFQRAPEEGAPGPPAVI